MVIKIFVHKLLNHVKSVPPLPCLKIYKTHLASVLLRRGFLDQNWTGWLPKGYQREIVSKNLAQWDLSEGGGVCLWDGTIDKLSRKYHLQGKEIQFVRRHFPGRYMGQRMATWGRGRVGGMESAKQWPWRGRGILILVQDFIRGEYYFGDSNKSESNCYFTLHFQSKHFSIEVNVTFI